MTEKVYTKRALFSNLSASKSGDLDATIRQAKQAKADAIIVLDDDPTGTQTVYDIPVLTSWKKETIQNELSRGTPLFYILTNSRSLVEKKAKQLGEAIGQNINRAAKVLDKKCLVISRSDSTLRGHYPSEVVALEKGLAINDSVHFIIPAFFEGGRYTINNIHYVQNGEQMIPAAQTSFARDKVFGYQASNMKEWVSEKIQAKVPVHKLKSISLDDLRTHPVDYLITKINAFQSGDICIVNAADYQDLKQAAIAILQSGVYPVFRTAASFVAALAAQLPKAFLNATDLEITSSAGGLIVVGSYVPKTSQQLEYLQANGNIESIELDVAKLLAGRLPEASSMAKSIDVQLQAGRDVVIYTSRKLISTSSAEENLAIGEKVSNFVTDIVANLSVRPRYILAKGGITSSDIATESLLVKRAMVQGQIIAGVPVWKLGDESKFPGLSYIVFPGNVGDEKSVSKVVEKLKINQK